MQNRKKFVKINKKCGRQLCNLLKKFSLFCTNSGKNFFESLCNLPIDKICRVWYNGISGRHEGKRPPSNCTKIFNIFKNFCAFCTLCKLHNNILTNQPPHFCASCQKSIGKVNKPCLLSLVILPIDFRFLCSFNKERKAVQGLLKYL